MMALHNRIKSKFINGHLDHMGFCIHNYETAVSTSIIYIYSMANTVTVCGQWCCRLSVHVIRHDYNDCV